MVSSYDLLLPGARAAGSLSNRQDDQQRRQSLQRVAGSQLARPPKPFGNSYSRLQLQAPVQPAMQAPPQGVPEMPEQGDSGILSSATAITQPAIGAVGGLANILDLPGSMIRDLISLENPLDQLLSPHTSENRTTGEQILENWNLYEDGPNANRSSLASIGRFVGGLGVEVLLDPLTYLSGGLTAGLKAGGKTGMKAAGRIGLVDDSIFALNKRLTDAAFKKTGKKMGKREAALTVNADEVLKTGTRDATKIKTAQLNTRLATDMGEEFTTDALKKAKSATLQDAYFTWQLPGLPSTRMSFLRGEKAKSYARFVDTLGEKTRFGKLSPVMRLAPIFSKASRNAKGPGGQREALELSEVLLDAQAAARGQLYEANTKITESGMLNYGVDGMSDAEKIAANKNVEEYSDRMFEYMEDINAPRIKEKISKSDDGSIVVERSFSDDSLQTNSYKNEAELKSKDPDAYQDYLNMDASAVKNELTRTYADPAHLESWKLRIIKNDIEAYQAGRIAKPYYKDMLDNGVLEALDNVKGTLKGSLRTARKTGVDLSEYSDDYASYASRLAINSDTGDAVKRMRGARALDPRTEFSIQRSPERRNIVGGTASLQRMSRTGEAEGGFAGMSTIGRTPVRWKVEADAEFARFKDKYQTELAGLDGEKSRNLFDDITSRPEGMVRRRDAFYKTNPAEAALRSVDSLYEASAKARGLRSFLRNQTQLPTGEGVERLRERAKAVFSREAGDTSPIDTAMDATGDIFIDNLGFLRKVDIIDQREIDGTATQAKHLQPEPGGVGGDLSPDRDFEDDLFSVNKSDESGFEGKNPDELGDDDLPDFDGGDEPPSGGGSSPSGSSVLPSDGVTDAEYRSALEMLSRIGDDINPVTNEELIEKTDMLYRLGRSGGKKLTRKNKEHRQLFRTIAEGIRLREPRLWQLAKERKADAVAAAKPAAAKPAAARPAAASGGIVDVAKPAAAKPAAAKAKEKAPYPKVLSDKLTKDESGKLVVPSASDKRFVKSGGEGGLMNQAKRVGVPIESRTGKYWTGNDILNEMKARIDGNYDKWEEKAREVAAGSIENVSANASLKAYDILASSSNQANKQLASVWGNRVLQRSTTIPKADRAIEATKDVADHAKAVGYARELLGLIDDKGKNPSQELVAKLRTEADWTEAKSLGGVDGIVADLRLLYARFNLDLSTSGSNTGIQDSWEEMESIDKFIYKLRSYSTDAKIQAGVKAVRQARSKAAERDAIKKLKDYTSTWQRNRAVSLARREGGRNPRPEGQEYFVNFDANGDVGYATNANMQPLPSLENLVDAYKSAGRKEFNRRVFGEGIDGYEFFVRGTKRKENKVYLVEILNKRINDIKFGKMTLSRARDQRHFKTDQFSNELSAINLVAEKGGSLSESDKYWIKAQLGRTGFKLRDTAQNANTKTIANSALYGTSPPPKWLTDTVTSLRTGKYENVPDDIAGFIYQNWERIDKRTPGFLNGVPSPIRKTRDDGTSFTTINPEVSKLLSPAPPQVNRSEFGSVSGMGLLTDPVLLKADPNLLKANEAFAEAFADVAVMAPRRQLSADEVANNLAEKKGVMKDSQGGDMTFADVMSARQAQQDRMTEVIDGLADDDAANIALLAREGEPDPSEFLRSLPPETRAKAEAGADAAIKKAQETSKARGPLKKKAQGGGLVGRVDTPKSKPPARRQDQSIDPDLSGDQPLGRSLFSFGRAANQTGAGRMGLISTHLDIGAANYNPILQSTSQDVAALVQELKKPYQTYEDFFNADIKEMQEILNTMG